MDNIVGQRMFCIGCFREGAMVKVDKKHRPYFVCECCGTRSFFRGPGSLKGWAVVYDGLSKAFRSGDRIAARSILDSAEAAAAVAEGV